jgi:hypothetical protein
MEFKSNSKIESESDIMAITTITTITVIPPIYMPSFNPHTGKYVDVCPIPSRQRAVYRCKCNHKDTLFNTPSEFKTHIKLKKHIYYVEHYLENIKELDDCIQQNKKLQTEYELMYRKLNREINILKNKIVENGQKILSLY